MTRFLEFLLSNVLATALLALVVYVLCRFITRPAMRHALWLIVLIRLFLPPVWSISLPEAKIQSVEVSQIDLRELSTPEVLGSIPETNFDEMVSLQREAEDQPRASEPSAIIPTEPPPALAAGIDGWLALEILFLSGSLGIFLLSLRRVIRFQHALRNGVAAGDSLRERVETLSQKMGLRTPEILLVAGRIPPLIWFFGWTTRQARLVLPLELTLRLPPHQLDAILVHELAHLRRGDHWVRWLETLSLVVFWWFPLLGWIRRQLRTQEEHCCDAWVVSMTEDRRSYADALLETVVFLDGSPSRTPLLASGVAPIRDLHRRISMIMRGSRASRMTRFGLVASIGFAFLAIAVGPSLSQADPDEKDPPRKEKEGRSRGEDKDLPQKGDFRGQFPQRGEFKGREGEAKGREGERKNDPQPANREGIEKARKERDEAARQLEKAMMAMKEAEERLMKLEGRRPEGLDNYGRPMGFPPFRSPEGNPRPMAKDQPRDQPREQPRAENPREGDPRGGDRLENLERQLRRLTEELEAIRRENGRTPENVRPPNRPEENPRPQPKNPRERRDNSSAEPLPMPRTITR